MKSCHWERGQAGSRGVDSKRLDDFRHRVKSAFSQGSEDTHEYRLRLRALLALVAQDVFAHDHRWADFPFGMVVIRRHTVMIQKGEQMLAVLAQPFHQAFDVGVVGSATALPFKPFRS